MQSELFLIAHKVRGEATFDIAEKMSNGWWIIPTSGHRAFPYWEMPLDRFMLPVSLESILSRMPPETQDHYRQAYGDPKGRDGKPSSAKIDLEDLLS